MRLNYRIHPDYLWSGFLYHIKVIYMLRQCFKIAICQIKWYTILVVWRITQVWLKGTVLKTVRRVKACVGSNPTSSLGSVKFHINCTYCFCFFYIWQNLLRKGSYSRGLRGRFAKSLGREIDARVRIPYSP